MLKIAVILGSTREGRFGEKPARWIVGEIQKREGVAVDLLDLRDYELPFFNQPVSPGWISEPYADETVARWTKAVAAHDAYVVVAPEYNRSPSGVMKNAFDWVYKEWNRKPIGFVGYGSVGGARAVEQMRLIAVELQMAPISHGVHMSADLYMSMMKDASPIDPARFAPVKHAADVMIDQLVWWGKALKTAREGLALAAAA